MKELIIALPKKLYMLRPEEKQDIVMDVEEYNIYFENIILPYHESYDVKIQCDYGKNYGSFWRITQFPYHIDSFPLKLTVYDEWGEKLSEKECTVILSDKKEATEMYHMLCIGDSMTHSADYLNHISHKLKNVSFLGSRSFDGHIFMEGRGGWSYQSYFTNHAMSSPFLFPKGVEPELYLGDLDFEHTKQEKNGCTYAYNGFSKYALEEGMFYHRGGKIWQLSGGKHCVVLEEPVWEFSFTKYMKRYVPGAVDCVSLLMGANDLQVVDYEDSDEAVEAFIANTERVIASIREYDPSLPVILNLPIAGADQLAWGKQMGCVGTSKQYRYNMIKAAQAMIDRWGESKDSIYLSAMSLNIDRKTGFDAEMYRANRYSDKMLKGQGNWVHPNQIGYMQMGDALAAVIEHIRK